MLINLHIENYALIRQTDISFGPGFVAITGETGAGKSILLGALGLLLGQRADTAVLADKERKCIVEAQFDISALGLEPFFAEADVDYDCRTIIRREILPSAKSRAFVNDTPVSLVLLKQLGERLIDIHSQHQTLTIAEAPFRLRLLDALINKEGRDVLSHYREAYGEYTRLKKELEELTSADAQNRKDADYLQFQLDELCEARLAEGEQEALEEESQLLSHAEAVSEALGEAASLMDNDEGYGVLSGLNRAKASLSHVVAYHKGAEELLGRVESALIDLDDIAASLRQMEEGIVYNPQRQMEVDDRLSLIYRLEKKHSVNSVAELIEIRDRLDARLQSISNLDERIGELMEQVDKAFTGLQRTADRLTALRREAGKSLQKEILPILKALGIKDAKFEVKLEAAPSYTALGHDSVALMFNANKGGELQDVGKVASGGELSRLMLGIKSILASHSHLPTIIFDEIDTGVSGEISLSMGRIMRKMAEGMQVVAITHQPQIAALATQHLKVYKHNESDKTVSSLCELAIKERVAEVAMMLSSETPTAAALQTAKELMQTK